MARKRDVVARVGADTSEFDSKMGASAEALDKFGKLGAAAGKLVAAGMVAAAAGIATLTARGIELGDALDDAAAGLGLTVDGLASLRYAAKFANVDAEQLDASLAKLARTTSMAAEGNKLAAETLGRIGLSGRELRELSLDEQFEAVADGLAGVANETDRARIAQDIFGRSGAKLLPLLNQGGAAIRAQREEARALGLTLDEVQRKNIVQASDAMDKLKASVDGASLQLAGAFGPAIEAGAEAVTRLVQAVVDALPRLQALAERFFGVKAAADSLSDLALTETLHEQIRALDEVNNQLAEEQAMLKFFAEGGGDYALAQERINEKLEEQAATQARINELLAERVKRRKDAEALAAAGAAPVDEEDEPLTGDDAAKAAQAELDLVTAVYEERERLRVLEMEQEAEWRQALFEERERFALEEVEAERELVDALLIEQQRYREETAARDAEELARKRRVRKETVDNAFAGFTQITAALAAHNEKAFKLNKVAAKAEAGLNAFRAIQQVWADETLPFYAKIAATAITAAATAANIAAINKTEFGGGAVPSNLGATPVTPAGGALPNTTGNRGNAQTIIVQGLSEDALFSGSSVRGLLERLQEALKDGGKLVVQT